jgi:hypothetical protein
MKRIPYLWYICLAGILINELFLIQKNVELLHVLLFVALPLVLVVSFIVWFFTKQPVLDKFKKAVVPLLLFILYFCAGNWLETAAFNISFGLHQGSYEDLAEQILAKADSFYKAASNQAPQDEVYVSEFLYELLNDNEIKDKQRQLGIWGANIYEIKKGKYVVELKILAGRQSLGLIYNPTGGMVPENTFWAGRTFWRSAPPWSMGKESSGGFAAPG